MVLPVKGPQLSMERELMRVAHLRHEVADIRPSPLNPGMVELFASPRIVLKATRTHLGREAHRKGVVGNGIDDDG